MVRLKTVSCYCAMHTDEVNWHLVEMCVPHTCLFSKIPFRDFNTQPFSLTLFDVWLTTLVSIQLTPHLLVFYILNSSVLHGSEPYIFLDHKFCKRGDNPLSWKLGTHEHILDMTRLCVSNGFIRLLYYGYRTTLRPCKSQLSLLNIMPTTFCFVTKKM